jgi:actin-like ATPase involved in cell morphogenesis
MTSEPVITIDFGTSYSSAAVFVDGRIVPIKEPASLSWSFPSSVCRTDTELLVGTPAENARRSRSGGYRSEFKRDFGQNAPVELAGTAYSVTELTAAMFATLREQAEKVANQPVRAAVLTVPVDYGRTQRDLMLVAASKAGLTGQVTVVEEPIAAAFAPAHGPMPQPGELMLVYDLGGGTFDAALLTVTRTGFTVNASAGLPACGGSDIDRLLYSWLRTQAGNDLEPFLTVASGADPASHRAARTLRLSLLEFLRIHIKHQLSSATAVNDTFTEGPVQIRVAINASEFRALIEPVIRDSITCCRELLRSSHHEADDLAALLLVGGGTRMPFVTDALREAFGRPIRHAEDPELAVAHGAAHWISRQPRLRTSLVESILVADGLTTLAVAPDAPGGGPLAVSGGVDGVLRVWNLNDGTAGPVIAAHDGPVSSIDVSADGDTVASGGMDGTVHLWNPGQEAGGTAFFHGSWVNTVRITADGSHLLSVGDDGHWRCGPLPAVGKDRTAGREPAASGGENRGTPAAEGRLSGTRATAGALAAATPGQCAIADSAGLIRLATQLQIAGGPGDLIGALALDPAGKRLAAGYTNGTVKVWELPDGRLSAQASPGTAVRDLRFGPGGLLASGHSDGTVRVWNPGHPRDPEIVGSHDGPARAIAFPAGELVVSAGADGHIRLWPVRAPQGQEGDLR